MTAKRPMRRPVTQAAGLDNDCRDVLLTGLSYGFTGYFGDASDPQIEARMREDWETHREELVADWITSNPGSRPWAWWEFDAPEGRRVSDGTFDRQHRVRWANKWQRLYPKVGHLKLIRELFFGIPRISLGEQVQFETERACLKRLDLLLPGELEAIQELETAETIDA